MQQIVSELAMDDISLNVISSSQYGKKEKTSSCHNKVLSDFSFHFICFMIDKN